MVNITTTTGTEWRLHREWNSGHYRLVTADFFDGFDDEDEDGIAIYECEDGAHEVYVAQGYLDDGEQARLATELAAPYGCEVVLAEMEQVDDDDDGLGNGQKFYFSYRVTGAKGHKATWKKAAKLLFSAERKRTADRRRKAERDYLLASLDE